MKMVRVLLVLMMVLAVAVVVGAQAPPAAGAGAQRGPGGPGGPGAPGGGAPGGAGGGRGGAGGGRGGGGGPALTMTTTAFADGTDIPVRYAQAGMSVSPEFKWTNTPMGTASFVLIMHDPDVAIGGTDRPDDVLHWMIWNIPGAATGLPENVPQGAKIADGPLAGAEQVSLRGAGYMGPGAAATGPKHHYTFELYALDTMLTITPGATPAETRAAVYKAMVGHTRGKAAYVGLYHAPAAQ